MTQEQQAAFKREERYIVIKRKHLNAIQETAIRAHMARMGIGTVECVVVESDWLEYETVWGMIEARCVVRDANDRLIAAAPELLEAALKALNFIENTESEMGEALSSGDSLRAAIAKAGGAS